MSVAASGVVRVVAVRLGMVVPPRPDRWHRAPTPTYGGIAVLASVLVAIVLVGPRPIAPVVPIIGVAGALFVAGWYDDLVPMSALTKMVSSLSVAAFFAVTLTRF